MQSKLPIQLCVVLFLTCTLVPAHAWDPFGIGAKLEEKVDAEIDAAVAKVQTAFLGWEKHLFDQVLNPLVDKINAMYLDYMGKAKAIIEKLVTDAVAAIDKMIDHAFAEAEKVADETIDMIQKKFIDVFNKDVLDIETKFFQNVSDAISKIEKQFDDVDCKVKGNVDKLVHSIINHFSTCTLLESCCKNYTKAWKPVVLLSSLTHPQQYDLMICRTVLPVENNVNATKHDLISAYEQGQILARDFTCIDFNNTAIADHLAQEYLKWGAKYNFWAHGSGVGNTKASQDFISFQSKR